MKFNLSPKRPCLFVAMMHDYDRPYARLQYRRLRRVLSRDEARTIWYGVYHTGWRAGHTCGYQGGFR